MTYYHCYHTINGARHVLLGGKTRTSNSRPWYPLVLHFGFTSTVRWHQFENIQYNNHLQFKGACKWTSKPPRYAGQRSKSASTAESQMLSEPKSHCGTQNLQATTFPNQPTCRKICIRQSRCDWSKQKSSSLGEYTSCISSIYIIIVCV